MGCPCVFYALQIRIFSSFFGVGVSFFILIFALSTSPDNAPFDILIHPSLLTKQNIIINNLNLYHYENDK